MTPFSVSLRVVKAVVVDAAAPTAFQIERAVRTKVTSLSTYEDIDDIIKSLAVPGACLYDLPYDSPYMDINDLTGKRVIMDLDLVDPVFPRDVIKTILKAIEEKV